MDQHSPRRATRGGRGARGGEILGARVSATPLERPGARGKVVASIVVPAYNEARRMEESLPRFLSVYESIRPGGIGIDETEVIVVDDGSTDDTIETAAKYLGDLPHVELVRIEKNAGKGAAVRAGVARARGAMIAYVDADMASDPAGIPALFAALDENEVAIGSRVLPQSTVNCWDPKRIFFGRAFNRFVRLSTGMSLPDTQCGFKAFRAPAAKLLFHASTVDRYAFDVEILMLAHKLGMRIAQVPVAWTDMKGSHVRPMLDALPMLGDVVRAVTTWRKTPPVEAVAVVSALNGSGGTGPGDMGTAIRDSVRYSDPVLVWPHGALALLPCRDPVAAAAVRSRLAQRLPGCRISKSTVTLEMLLHPSAAPLMEALCCLPRPEPQVDTVECDQPTAKLLLSALGVG